MLQLFPKYKKRILLSIGIWLAFLAACAMLFPRVSPAALIIGGIVGALVVYVWQVIQATTLHNSMLATLYNQLDVERFLRMYEPLLDISLKHKQLYLMVRLHISNAYCAQGRFEDAIALLSSMEIPKDKPENTLLARFSITSNLCYCAEQMNDTAAARKHLDALLALKAQLEALQASKPENKRVTFSTAFNEQCVKFLETGKADIEFLKTQVQQTATQQLHRINTSLWIARAYLAQNNRREAEKLLTRIVELAPDLYPGQAAREMLNKLPK